MKLRGIKLIATDLDGTLFSSDGTLSDENKAAIGELYKKGIQVVPVSGRCDGEFPEELKSNPYIRYRIHSAGARVVDSLTGWSVAHPIDKKTVLKAHEIIKKYDGFYDAHIGGNAWIAAKDFNDERMDYCCVSAYFKRHFDAYGLAAADFEEKLFSGDVDMLGSICFHTDEQKAAAYEEFSRLPGNLVSSDGINLEFTSALANKGDAIRTLCGKLGIELSEVIVVGDSLNDMSMMEVTENSFAMENACEALKERASYVACKNTEHVIKYFLDEIIE